MNLGHVGRLYGDADLLLSIVALNQFDDGAADELSRGEKVAEGIWNV
jgi:hypothetical protein